VDDVRIMKGDFGIYDLIFGGKRNDLPFKFLQSVLKIKQRDPDLILPLAVQTYT
jgi:hypothetical protein